MILLSYISLNIAATGILYRIKEYEIVVLVIKSYYMIETAAVQIAT